MLIFLIFIFGIDLFANMFTWEEVLKESLRNNPEIANIRNELKLSEISYRSSLLNYYPDFSGSMSMRESDSNDTSYSYGLTGKLSLFRGYKNSTDIKIKKTSLKIQEAIYKRKLSDFVYNLRISFAKLLKLKKTITLLERIEKRRENNMELVKLRYEAGREDKGAYLRARADYFLAKFETEKAKRNYKIVKAELLKNMGKDIYELIDITGTFNIPEIKKYDTEKLLQTNPDYIIAEYGLRKSEYELKYKYGDFYPEIALSGSITKSGNKFPTQENSWNVGLSLSYPFFSKGKDFYELKSKKLNKLIAENELINIKRELFLNIEKAYNDLIDAIEYYKVREEFFNASKTRAEISREKYINGLISYVDWDSIENEFINAQKLLLDAQYDVFAV